MKETPPSRLDRLGVDAVWVMTLGRIPNGAGLHQLESVPGYIYHLLDLPHRAFATLPESNQSPRESIRARVMQHCGVRLMIHCLLMIMISVGQFTCPLSEQSLFTAMLLLHIMAH